MPMSRVAIGIVAALGLYVLAVKARRDVTLSRIEVDALLRRLRRPSRFP